MELRTRLIILPTPCHGGADPGMTVFIAVTVLYWVTVCQVMTALNGLIHDVIGDRQ